MDLAFLDELRADPLRQTRRNREADALEAAARRVDGCVDADYFALQIHQRPTAIARINRGIRLNEFVVARDADSPAHRANNALGHGVFQAKRLTDRQDPIA